MSKIVELVKMAMVGDAHGFKAGFENTMAARVNGLVEKQFSKMNESKEEDGDDEDDNEDKDEGKEELDEISKERVGQYALKALADRSKAISSYNKSEQERSKASYNAGKVAMKGPDKDYGETSDQHRERVDRLKKRAEKHDAEGKAANKTIEKRAKGLGLAGKQLAKD